MRLEGLHHVTAITADAPRNVHFYVEVLGLRMVKKTVNFDAPDVYHLYYADEHGSPGSVMTFFEFPGAAQGRAGFGMVHRVIWRVAGDAALDFWHERVGGERGDGSQRVAHPEGRELELVVSDAPDPPLVAGAADIPAEHALQGFDGVRAYTRDAEASERLLTGALGFERTAECDYLVAGERRRASYGYDRTPPQRGVQGYGTVHHVAWCSPDGSQDAWRERVQSAGAQPTPIIDRTYFRSVYFREPSAVLFELATPSPGFAVDEEQAHLGEALRLPPQHEHLRERLEQVLTPLENPRAPARS